MRSVVGKFCIPIAGHSYFDFRAITAGRPRGLDLCSFVPLDPRHVHVGLKFDRANIDKLTAGIAKFDQHIVVAVFELPSGREQLDGEIVYGLGGKRRASNFSSRGFVPDETRAVNQPNRDESGGHDSWQMTPDTVRWYQRRRHNWRRCLFSSVRQFASPPDDVD